ncbi:MAG: PilZ domain-containing protein [Pseudomonadota bacterium]
MADFALAERRSKPRIPTESLVVSVRRKGRINRLVGLAINFNRYGVAIVLDQPLNKDSTVYLALSHGDTHVDELIGVVHNCISQDQGYRCGIQFRTQSPMQFDREMVESRLRQLEARFSAHTSLTEV